MSVARILGTMVTAATVLAASMAPVAAQEAPGAEPAPEATESTLLGLGLCWALASC